MPLRKVLFWCHLITGVTVGTVVLMMSVTGVLLTYEAQLNRWDLRAYRSTEAPEKSDVLPLDTLLASVSAVEPGATPTSLRIMADSQEPVAVNVGGGRLLFVDRYTAEVLGDNDRPMRRFLRGAMAWHRWFSFDDERRWIGRALTGVSNLAFLFLVMSGFYLWWPRIWSTSNLRQITWFRVGLTGRARNYNWHNVIGFWLVVPLTVIIFSGSVISYSWMSDFAYRLVGEGPPERGASLTNGAPTPEQPRPSREVDLITYQGIFERVNSVAEEWQALTIRMPDENEQNIVTLVDRGNGRQPSKQHELVFDRVHGEFVERTGYPTYSRGRKFRRWLRFAHTGEVYGVAGQTLAGVAATGAVVLVWTGFAMAWKRFRNRTSGHQSHKHV